jgi:hypothetical protein
MGGLLAGFFTHSYNGHYTPIAFGLELLLSAIFGPHEWIWLTRQALVFAVLGVALFRLMRATLPVPIAFAATVVFMAQPLMLEIASWPFMVMQLGYLIFFAVTASLLIDFARQPKATTLWWTVSVQSRGLPYRSVSGSSLKGCAHDTQTASCMGDRGSRRAHADSRCTHGPSSTQHPRNGQGRSPRGL